jgi:hypothetical protein
VPDAAYGGVIAWSHTAGELSGADPDVGPSRDGRQPGTLRCQTAIG